MSIKAAPSSNLTKWFVLTKFDSVGTDSYSWKFWFNHFVKLMEVPEDKYFGLLIKSLETKPFQTLVWMRRPNEPPELYIQANVGKTGYCSQSRHVQSRRVGSLLCNESRQRRDSRPLCKPIADKKSTSDFPRDVLDNLLSAVFVTNVKCETTQRYLMQNDLRNFEQRLDADKKLETGRQKAEPDTANQQANKSQKKTKVNEKCKRVHEREKRDRFKWKQRWMKSLHKTRFFTPWWRKILYKNTRSKYCTKSGHIERTCRGKENDRWKKDEKEKLGRLNTVHPAGDGYDILSWVLIFARFSLALISLFWGDNGGQYMSELLATA